MRYTDDEVLMIHALVVLQENRDDVSTGESEAYMENFYDHVIDLLKQRLYKDAK